MAHNHAIPMGTLSYGPSSIYYMGLHDVLHFDGFTVRRVPGGWIYRFFSDTHANANAGARTGATFVPWNNEFKP